MPRPYKLNRRFRRVQLISNEHQNSKQSKPIQRKCLSAIKIIQIGSAVLVPLMIGVFTLITTLNESNSEQSRQKAEQRNRELDVLKGYEQQQRDSINAKEIQMQNVYDTFMKDISPIVLKENINLTDAEITFARAKTLLTLEQIDPKRKWYLIKFLYDNQLLRTYQPNVKYLDLDGADLSNVYFGSTRRFNRMVYLKDILLAKLQLKNSTFENVDLHGADFGFSDLNSSTFLDVAVTRSTFQDTIMENTKLILRRVEHSSFKDSKLKSSSWSAVSTSVIFNNVDYSNCDLSGSTFQGFEIKTAVKFDGANVERISFVDVSFSSGISFEGKNMRAANFTRVQLNNGKFTQCNMTGAVFENIKFKNTIFEQVDLKESQFNDIPEYGSIHFRYVNLFGSNLNTTRDKLFRITDSMLPDGTYTTSFMFFGINLIKNANAEQGQCYDSNQSFVADVPQDWSRHGDVVQISYEK